MATQNLRRRRGEVEPTESTTSTTTEVTSVTTANEETSTPSKSIDQILQDESSALSNFLGMAAIICLAFLYMVQSTDVPPPRRVYGIMIDAGSTGTRAQVFQFHHEPNTSRLVLDSSKMFKMKKSLAALAVGTTGTGPQFFKPLLDKAKTAIPGMRRRQKTPIALRATAGLRLIGSELAENALRLTSSALNSTEYSFKEGWVSIISEKDEANQGWITVNYLLGNLDSGKKESEKQYVGALELGGASMQLSFRHDENTENIDEEEQEKTPYPATVENINVFGKTHEIHSRSYLGAGLFDFTKKLYVVFDNEGVLEEGNPCFRKGKVFEGKKLRLGVPGSEESRTVTISGDGDFERCVASAEIIIGSFSRLLDKRSRLPRKSTFYAFAYFFDRTAKLGLPRNPTRDDFISKGKELCETNPEVPLQGDFDEACAEFSYIFALMKILTNDFSKEDDIKINFVQYIDRHMLGWSLGAVLDIIQPEIHQQLALDDEPLFAFRRSS